MSNNFWENLVKPIYALAPMAGITDSAFRQICKSCGADVVYSEMASAGALYYDARQTLEMLNFSPAERPYVVQLFGSNPEHFKAAAGLIEHELRPDGIDINFGCPARKVLKQGAGSALMDEPALARRVIEAVLAATKLPVSIKLRVHSGKTGLDSFLRMLAAYNIKAVMIHGRTSAQGFAGQLDFAAMKNAREKYRGIILANGGIYSARDAENVLAETGADGIGIARGALGNPWLFGEAKGRQSEERKKKEVILVALRHARLAEQLKGRQGIIEMRKHLCWYVRGFPGAGNLRQRLVKVLSLAEIKAILQKI